MNRIACSIAAAILPLLATAAFAHPNHDAPPIKREEVPILGERVVKLLVQDKKLAPSWQGRPVKEVSSRETSQGLVWVVSDDNPGEADKAKRTVYMIFDEFGNFLGGNHTGMTQ